MKHRSTSKNIVVYQAKGGAIALRSDYKKETIWATQSDIAGIFAIERSVVTKHLNNLLKTGEVNSKSNVQKMHIAHSDKPIHLYSLDVILAVGYRINSIKAIAFRKWASKTLKAYITDGYIFNKQRITKNYTSFLQAVESLKQLLPAGSNIYTEDILELIKTFANTWFSLQAYDQATLPRTGATKKQVVVTTSELMKAISELKKRLQIAGEASELFAQARDVSSVENIISNVCQSFEGKDLYPSVEEKAAHLLYFMVKDHPFVDGNKRCGAFAFIWFLTKAKLLNINRLSPEALTTLTLFIATSNPKEKDRMVSLILQLISS